MEGGGKRHGALCRVAVDLMRIEHIQALRR